MKIVSKVFLILALGLIFSCEDLNGPEDGDSKRIESINSILKNWSEAIIPNSFQEANNQLFNLKTGFELAAADNVIEPTELSEIQDLLKNAWIGFVQVGPFDFGPSDAYLLNAYGNTFPADTALIEENAAANNYNLDPVSQIDAQGFPTLDYLFNSGVNLTEAHINYASEVINRLENLITTVNSEFASESYQIAFQENNGSDINSSMALTLNAMIKEFEIIKNPRIGIPLGKKTLGQQRPEQVESLYGKYSIDLARKNWEKIIEVYYGESTNTETITGVNNLLEADLKADIDTQIQAISEAFNAIPTNNLQEALVNHPVELENLYNTIQGLVVLWKTDMMSTLGLQINYQDNDGD